MRTRTVLSFARACASCLLSGMLACASVSAAVPELPRFRVVGVAQGLPSTGINAIAADHAGYVWVATADGLARYDGVGFRVWRQRPGVVDALPGNNVQALHVDARDRVWVATESSGLSVLDAQRRHFRHYTMASDPAIGSDDVWAISSRGDDLWFGTYGGGLHHLAGDGRITRYMPRPGDQRSLPAATILSLAFDRQGRLWIGTTDGLATWTGHDFARIALPGTTHPSMVYSLNVEGERLWAGTDAGAFRRDPDGQWRQPSWSPMFARPNAMEAFAVDADGRCWIGSQGGLWRCAGDGIPEPVDAGGRGVAKAVVSLLLRGDGALWAPIPGLGLGYLRADWRGMARLRRGEGGLSAVQYRAFAPAHAGGVWAAGVAGAPEWLRPDGSVQAMPDATVARLRGMRFNSIVEASDGGLWLGFRQGLVRIDRNGGVREWRDGDSIDAPLSGTASQLRISADGSLWCVFDGGGLQQRDGRDGRVLRNLPTGTAGVDSGDIEALELDGDGAPWIAGEGGVARWQGDRFVRWTVAGSRRVYALDFDGHDTAWLSRLTGLERYHRDGDEWRRTALLDTRVGIPAVEAAGLRVDSRHRPWLATTRGLFRWDPTSRRVRRFGLEDGLDSQEFVDHAMTLTDAGVVAAATFDGSVVLVDSAAGSSDAPRPTLRVDEVAMRRGGRWQSTGDAALELPPDVHELRVRLRLLAFEDPTANRYASWLEGFDHGWVEQGANGDRVFSGLAPGAYHLRLRARDAAGIDAPVQQLRFRVAPPWWRTPSAIAGFRALALGLLALLVHRWSVLSQRSRAWRIAREEREQAQRASLAKSHFLATLGHEVRTPMTGVLGMGELLLGTHLDARQRRYAESIRDAGNHLLRLVNDALDIARIEAGKLEPDRQPFALHDLLLEVEALLAPVAARRALAFELRIAEATPGLVLGDPRRLRQVLLNLLGNALKFTEHGSVVLQVAPLQDSPRMMFEVSDTGPGMDAAQLARLFQRFEQAEGNRTTSRYGGSGLGLAICRELAIAMGGGIHVDSTPGRGTRFVVDLPLPAVETPAPAPLPPACVEVAPPRLRILLVEDDAIVAEVITGLLQARGHAVTCAGHGLTALAELATSDFQLALLDLDLPGMDGCALARQVRAHGYALPLLAITARADVDAEAQARAAGCAGFLRKPLTGVLLAQAIAALLAPQPAVAESLR